MFAFDDQFDGGVAELLFGVVAFDKVFAAVLAGFEAFYNVHIVPRWVAVSCRQSACIHWGAQVSIRWTRFALSALTHVQGALRPSCGLGLVGRGVQALQQAVVEAAGIGQRIDRHAFVSAVHTR